ncbi:MAG: hypothetical protein EOP53_24795, partial [Sphingobacteriales bacterium]
MKKNLLLFLAFAGLTIEANAQIKITSADMPKNGDVVFYSTSSNKIDVSKTGENYDWDFSDLKYVSNDTFKFNNPSGIYAVAFFGNLARKSNIFNQEGQFFFKSNTTEWAQTGLGFKIAAANLDVPLKFKNSDQLYKFPLTYGSVSYADTFGGVTTIQTFKIAIHGKRETQVDGWGTIKTPYGTFNCIRLKSDVIEKDTISFSGVNNSRTEYTWLAKDQKIPVLQVVISANLQQQPTVTYRDSVRTVNNPIVLKPEFTADKRIIKVSETVSFTNKTAGTNNIYRWKISPASHTFIEGTNDFSENPKVRFDAEGKYAVELTATNGGEVGRLSEPDYITVNKTGNTSIRNSESIFQDVTIWPNPSAGNFTISLPKQIAG